MAVSVVSVSITKLTLKVALIKVAWVTISWIYASLIIFTFFSPLFSSNFSTLSYLLFSTFFQVYASRHEQAQTCQVGFLLLIWMRMCPSVEKHNGIKSDDIGFVQMQPRGIEDVWKNIFSDTVILWLRCQFREITSFSKCT